MCETSKTPSYRTGKRLYELRFREPLSAPIIPFGSLFEYHLISAKNESRLHQLGMKVLSGIFIGYVLCAGGILKGDIMVGDVEELDMLDALEIHARRLNEKEVLIPNNGEKIKFPVADGSHKLAGRDQVLRTPTLIQDDPARREEHNDVLQGESDGFRPTDHQAEDVEARDDFCSVSGKHHVGPFTKSIQMTWSS